jgi:cation diffusion facilitator CzcD-associated flavoprotein CzcO
MGAALVDYDVGIIGAGISGLIAALELKRTRVPFVVFERARRIGGVWRDNIYPGCGCDVRSYLYSIASRPNRGWTSNYAGQAEILAYLDQIVREDGLGAHIRLGADIRELRFIDELGAWSVRDGNGQCVLVGAIIVAIGPHSRPYVPELPGLKHFRGQAFHSSDWDSTVDLGGKKVVVVGTGASAVQIVPSLADRVSHLTVVQRSPGWVLPRGERRFSALEKTVLAHIPGAHRLTRLFIYLMMEFFAGSMLTEGLASALLARAARKHLHRSITDPQLRRKLTPDYRIGCKRILVSDDYFAAFNRTNVELVTDKIVSVTPGGIVTSSSRHHEADVIIFATGFHVADVDGLLPMFGSGGRSLSAEWACHGMSAYLGINVAGYPNMMMLLGPNSGPANSSAIHVVESQMRYILQYISHCRDTRGRAVLDVRTDVQRGYNEDLQRRLASTAWNSGCKSWYLDRQGRNTTMYPGLTYSYRRAVSKFRLKDYRTNRPRLPET